MNSLTTSNTDFNQIYKQAQRIAAAVFAVSSVIDNNEELKTKLKSVSIEVVSMSINLKDKDSFDIKRLLNEIQKKSLLLMSLLDIASLSGLISKMNGEILSEEFKGFILGLQNFENNFDFETRNSVQNILKKQNSDEVAVDQGNRLNPNNQNYNQNNFDAVKIKNQLKAGNETSRKVSRKTAILDFIKDNNNSSIKDIVPNIVGCSEKTVQRELIELINEGKIRKVGERRWSRYSLI